MKLPNAPLGRPHSHGPAAAVLLLLQLLLLPALLIAAEEGKRTFKISSSGAEAALKAFSEQSGRQVIAPTDLVKGVRTQAVQGEFTPREALDRLLLKSGLTAHFDDASGAFAIVREEARAPVAPKVVPTRVRDSSGARAGRDSSEEKSIELSPFVVAEEKDKGYQSRLTLAGNRLVSDIRDIGAAVSVYTKEFLDDINATTATDVLIYTPGMDAGGPFGNFSGAAEDINSPNVTTEVRQQAQPSRTRGLASPSFTRGYFPTSIPFDSYNTGAVTVSRGPNAILFGAGSPAGVVDTAMLHADLRKFEGKTSFTFGAHGSNRTVLDVNLPLIRDRLALRLIGLDNRTEYRQRPAFDDKRRLNVAVTAKPFRNTTVRANYEVGNNRNRSPQSVLPWDNVTPWLNSPRLVWDPSFYDDPARLPNAATTPSNGRGSNNTATLSPAYGLAGLMGQLQIFNQIAIVYNQPDSQQVDNAFRAALPSANLGTTGANAVRNNLYHPLVNRDNPNRTPGIGTNTADVFMFVSSRNLQSASLEYWQTLRPGITFVPPGIKNQGFTNYEYFNWRDQMLDTTYGQTYRFYSANIAVEQLAWKDRLGLEFVYNRQRFSRDTRNQFLGTANSNFVQIDTTVTLPTGQPNPNLGRPFMNSRSNYNIDANDSENLRLTGFIRYDFRDLNRGLGRWLGRHTLTGLYQEDGVTSYSYGYRLIARGPPADAMGVPIDHINLIPSMIVYIGDSVLGGAPLRFKQVTVAQPTVGLQFNSTWFNAPAGSTAQGDFVTGPAVLGEVNASGYAGRDVLKSQAFALQSHWLDDHLVTTVGWRKDMNYGARQTITNAITENPLPAGHYFARTPEVHQVHYNFKDFAFPRTPQFQVGREIKSWGAVLHWPQKILRLPWGISLSGFYNDSQNFTPAGARVDHYGNSLSPPIGTTKEYGLNLSFLNDRFMLRVNRFETSVQGQSIGAGPAGTFLGQAINQRFPSWLNDANIPRDDPRFAQAALDDLNTLISTLPANWRELYGITISGTPPNLSAVWRGSLPGSTDTTDFDAKGTELELTFNPNRQWRILFNAATQKTVQSNIAPVAREFFARMESVVEKLKNRPYDTYPLTNADGSKYEWGQPIPETSTWGRWLQNNVFIPYATQLATKGSASAEQPKWRLNLVGNYTFGNDAWLRGWAIGTGVRWQDKYALGYPVSKEVVNGPVFIDIEHPFWYKPQVNIDGWISYGRRIWKGRIGWKVQLNVRNLVADEDPIPVTVQPWGDPAITRLPPERSWSITNSFAF